MKDELDRQLFQLQRNFSVQAAQQLASELTQADLTNTRLLKELFLRLDDYLVRVASGVELIPLSAQILQHELQLIQDTELDRDDALILASILSHSRNQSEKKKAFLTGNVNDFKSPAVRELLVKAEIKVFSSTGNHGLGIGRFSINLRGRRRFAGIQQRCVFYYLISLSKIRPAGGNSIEVLLDAREDLINGV